MSIKQTQKITQNTAPTSLISFVHNKLNSITEFRNNYNPNRLIPFLKQAWKEKNIRAIIIASSSFLTLNLIYWFLPGWFFFGIYQTIFSKKIGEITRTKVEIGLREHQLSVRVSINSHSINIATLLSILPFVVGFSQFLTQKYKKNLNQVFFQKNIPIVGLPTEIIHWDTVQYILKDNLNFLKNIDRVHWAENSVLLTKQETTQPITFIGIVKTKNSLSESNSKNFQLSSRISQTKLEPLTNFYNKLDELPTKLDSNTQKTSLVKNQRFLTEEENTKRFLFSKPTSSESKNKFSTKQTTNSSSKRILLPKSNFDGRLLLQLNEHFLSALNLGPNLKNLNKNNNFFLEKQNKKEVKNTFLKNKINFFHNLDIFQNEFKNIFINKGLIPYLDGVSPDQSKKAFELIKRFNSNVKNIEESLFLEELIANIDDITLTEEKIQARRMSGYQYPDMTKNEVSKFSLQKLVWQKKPILVGLKIQLPSSFAITKTYKLIKKEQPEFLIESKPMILKDKEKDEILYQGLGLILNSQKGLDWETETVSDYVEPAKNQLQKNEKNLREWVQTYLSPFNSLNYFKENFFGVYESPEFKNQITKNSKDSSWLSNLPIYRNGVLVNLEPTLIPFESFIQVPFISELAWDEHYNKIKNELLINGDLLENNSKEISFPIIETRKPKIEYSKTPLGILGPVDYEFSSPLPIKNKIQNEEILTNLEFFPSNSSSLEEENFGNILASGIYQKMESIFANDNGTLFHDIWEPLTVRSWLIISQIGFAFLVFRVLKALADNYGRELLVYLLDLVAALGILDDDLKQEIEILMGQREKGFRIISKSTKNFNNVAGIKNLLPEIAEIVWFLRNSAREFSLSKTLPRGVLLTGPPGTGKTLLVQALAGEAQVPVLALSGSSLVEPGESGALKLEILFQEARRLAPCIVFIDEIDTLAQKRDQVMQNPMGADEILESINKSSLPSTPTNPARKGTSDSNFGEFESNSDTNFESETGKTEQLRAQQEIRQEQLSLLMQFLVELDGVQGRDGVIVIGATNRPEMLDSAVLRPGRFDRVLELGLPGQQKRLEILKLYAQRLGYSNSLSWEYLAQRTAGFTAADLASIMNESSLKAILSHTQHTLETIEHGIDRITTSETLKPKVFSFNDIATNRLAYYQAGKIVLSTILQYHPGVLVAHLWPRRTNIRSLQISSNVQKYFFQFARRYELEHRILGCYGGKAAEILFLQDTPSNVSSLGIEDLSFAQILITFIIDKWYLYSKTTAIKKGTQITENRNTQEFGSEQVEFLQELAQNIELAPFQIKANLGDIPSNQRSQSYYSTAWWQHQVSNELEFVERNFADWYRLYLPNPEETELNPEWSPPDDFYHRNKMLEHVSGSVSWNDLYIISRDYQIHSLILKAFNKALYLLDENRELLDQISYELLHKEILRESEIQNIFKSFGFKPEKTQLTEEKAFSTDVKKQKFLTPDLVKPQNPVDFKVQIVEKTWGITSRKKNLKWIDFETLTN